MTAPAPDRRLHLMTGEDQQRVRNAVADRGPGIFASPLGGGSRANVARYLAEGELGKQLADRHSWRTVWKAVAEVIDQDPTVIERSPQQAAADAQARTARVDAIVDEAQRALRADDLVQVARLLNEAMALDPDHRLPGVGGSRALGHRLAGIRDCIHAQLVVEQRAAAVGRFRLGEIAGSEARVRDTLTGEVVLVCHRSTAERWLAWHTAGLGGVRSWVEDNDFRLCACRHLCASHSSSKADYTQVPGVGNGDCGIEGCGCQEFRPVIAGPAAPLVSVGELAGGNSVEVVDSTPPMP
ncbi:hypothetical protein OOJ91_12545 [Micromonospora lupini]|uniref:hypothetical protein n=1 Tax=Micromonospora lupini TaxID=285679 RepID=UPI00224CB854|nr:hypothetical protein [Micromonospora lupini]MCX5066709.1 hypothetical protein [Micromonospora lupini]